MKVKYPFHLAEGRPSLAVDDITITFTHAQWAEPKPDGRYALAWFTVTRPGCGELKEFMIFQPDGRLAVSLYDSFLYWMLEASKDEDEEDLMFKGWLNNWCKQRHYYVRQRRRQLQRPDGMLDPSLIEDCPLGL